MNYTKRIDLDRQHVQVALGPEFGTGARSFSVELDLPNGLSADAALSLEAYHSSPPIRMRFDLGTVGSPIRLSPHQALLTDFPREIASPNFRLKVIDTKKMRGRILADARKIRPVNAADRQDTREGLLHIGHQDLDGVVWELEVDRIGYEPTLWIDTEADPARELARDPKFIALVYPEVLRAVLNHLIIDEQMNAIDDESEWGHAWLVLASGLPGMTGDELPRGDGDDDERRQWIGRAVRAFARHANARALVCPREDE